MFYFILWSGLEHLVFGPLSVCTKNDIICLNVCVCVCLCDTKEWNLFNWKTASVDEATEVHAQKSDILPLHVCNRRTEENERLHHCPFIIKLLRPFIIKWKTFHSFSGFPRDSYWSLAMIRTVRLRLLTTASPFMDIRHTNDFRSSVQVFDCRWLSELSCNYSVCSCPWLFPILSLSLSVLLFSFLFTFFLPLSSVPFLTSFLFPFPAPLFVPLIRPSSPRFCSLVSSSFQYIFVSFPFLYLMPFLFFNFLFSHFPPLLFLFHSFLFQFNPFFSVHFLLFPLPASQRW